MATDDVQSPVDRSGGTLGEHRLSPASGSRRPLLLEPSAPQAIEWTADQLLAGGLVAFPTDTVYALAASLARPDALRRIFAVKGRPAEKPLPVLISAADHLRGISLDLDPRVMTLAARYWPGPLTVVVRAREGMPEEVLGPHRTVGARVPNHFLAVEIIDRAGGAIAATSANLTNHAPALDAAEVRRQLGDNIDVLLDGGVAPGGVPSTVLAFNGDELIVIRDGAIPREHVAASWREVLEGDREARVAARPGLSTPVEPTP